MMSPCLSGTVTAFETQQVESGHLHHVVIVVNFSRCKSKGQGDRNKFGIVLWTNAHGQFKCTLHQSLVTLAAAELLEQNKVKLSTTLKDTSRKFLSSAIKKSTQILPQRASFVLWNKWRVYFEGGIGSHIRPYQRCSTNHYHLKFDRHGGLFE